MSHHSLWWTDPDPWDGSSKTREVSPNIETGSLEDNLHVWIQIDCIYNGIGYTIDEYYYTHLDDDDTEGPDLYYAYRDGDGTDQNPGWFEAWGYDESGGTFTTWSFYFIPNSLGLHSFTFGAVDYDNDRPGDSMTSSLTASINIVDDDTTPPWITIQYQGGDKTDGSPGQWNVNAGDQSGLAELNVYIDGVLKGSHTGLYNVPNTISTHTIRVYAKDNDKDRWILWPILSSDQLSSQKTNSVTIVDDDIEPPEIDVEYVGGYTDGEAGYVVVNAYDNIGLSLDPSGTYYLDSNIINTPQTFIFTAIDNDGDRDGDSLPTTSDPLSITLIDDDTSGPVVWINIVSKSWIGNEILLCFEVGATDNSGIGDVNGYIGPYLISSLGYYEKIFVPGIYNLEISVSDDDDDRDNDAATSTIEETLDLIPPETTITLDGVLGNNGWYISDVTVTLTATDANSDIALTEYSIDGASWIPYTDPFIITKEGITTVYYRSTDGADNIERVKNEVIKKDTIAPLITIIGPTAGYYNTNQIVSWTVTDANLDTVTASHSSPKVFFLDGIYQVIVTATDLAGNTATASSAQFVIDKTAPTTTLTIQEPYYGSDPTYVSPDTEFVLNAVDNPSGSDVYRIEYRIDQGDWIPYTAPFIIADIGGHIVYYRSIDAVGNVEIQKSVWIVVSASELTYIGDVYGYYSDPITLEAILIDVATQQPIPGKIIVFTIGDQIVSAITLSDGVARITIILDQPCGTYTVSVSFTEDGECLASFDSTEFAIEKEHVQASYTGSTVVPTTVETVTLRATVLDDVDGYWGDLTKIYVTFRIYLVPMDPLNPLLVYGPYMVETTIVDGVGVAIMEIPNLPENGYLVQISFDADDNNYYQGLDSDLVILIVYKPTGDFVTGGGWIEDSSGNKGNFGFNVKYKKNGLPKGQAIYVYREGDWEYIVKSNAWLGMAIVDTHAFFETKCVVQQYNSKTGEMVWGEGNYMLRIDVWDEDKDGGEDVFQIRIYDKIGLIYHEAGFDPYGFLQGGNIVIHSDKKK